MSEPTKKTEEVTPAPAAKEGSDIASAIAKGFKQSKEDSFVLTPDTGVEPRFAVVKNKEGEVMLRENGTGHLSKVQLESLEEKESSIQGQEVESVQYTRLAGFDCFFPVSKQPSLGGYFILM